ncbi:MAG TPA: hypothetical protein VLS88_14990 [Polyangiales bacterium]|nr:hypothetical protein [Polyangiales bacterium]
MCRSTATMALMFALSAAHLIACGNTESARGDVIVKQTLEDLPNCSNGRFGAVYYVVSEDAFYFCDGGAFIPVDLSGQDGRDGQDGQDGTSCTVARDDFAGTTTIRCEDGTEAVVYDGQDGQDGTSCSIAATAGGAAITCGTETVTITDGADGSSCTASTDASGAVTISCDDGTSATIPAGAEGELAVELICNVIGLNELLPPRGLECPPLYCPCFTAEEILGASVTGCLTTVDATAFPDPASTTETLPGGFIAYTRDSNISGARFYECVGTDSAYTISRVQFLDCSAIIEETVGPCERVVFCSSNFDCDDGNSCTDDICEAGQCTNPTKPNGAECDDGGQCFLGSCRPVVGGL